MKTKRSRKIKGKHQKAVMVAKFTNPSRVRKTVQRKTAAKQKTRARNNKKNKKVSKVSSSSSEESDR